MCSSFPGASWVKRAFYPGKCKWDVSCLSNYLYCPVLNADEHSLLSLADGNSEWVSKWMWNIWRYNLSLKFYLWCILLSLSFSRSSYNKPFFSWSWKLLRRPFTAYLCETCSCLWHHKFPVSFDCLHWWCAFLHSSYFSCYQTTLNPLNW